MTPHDTLADPAKEKLGTSANVVTLVRTVASVVVAGVGVHEESLKLLVIALAIYWLGDMLDGAVARVRGCETRIGAVLDIMSDRFCAAAFYIGFAWLEPEFVIPIFLYLAEFMVIDAYLSIAFLAWAIRSPNYFYEVDRKIYLWNWSKPAKAANSAIFAVLLLVTGWAWLGIVIATLLIALKVASLVRLSRIGLPIPVPVSLA